MTTLDALKTAALFLVAAVIQVSVLPGIQVGHASPDLILVLLVSVALLRGPLHGALAGFWVGLLLDTATLGTLGFTSLLLTVAGYWAGRFGDATTRSSAQPPLVAVAVATAAVTLVGAFMHFLLGESLPVRELVVGVLLPALGLNLLITIPVYRLTRRLYRPTTVERRTGVSAAV